MKLPLRDIDIIKYDVKTNTSNEIESLYKKADAYLKLRDVYLPIIPQVIRITRNINKNILKHIKEKNSLAIKDLLIIAKENNKLVNQFINTPITYDITDYINISNTIIKMSNSITGKDYPKPREIDKINFDKNFLDTYKEELLTLEKEFVILLQYYETVKFNLHDDYYSIL